MADGESRAARAAVQVPIEQVLARALRERPELAADLEEVLRVVRADQEWVRRHYTRPAEAQYARARGWC